MSEPEKVRLRPGVSSIHGTRDVVIVKTQVKTRLGKTRTWYWLATPEGQQLGWWREEEIERP